MPQRCKSLMCNALRQNMPWFQSITTSQGQSAARLEGARLSESPHEQWLRYYGRDGAWTRMSYRFALTQPTNYFRNQIVFIGTQPKTSTLDGETDKFCTPYTRWTGETTGGAEIMMTSFLNLVNDDWLRRAGRWMEALILVFTGTLLGGGLCRMRPLAACACAAVVAVAVMLGAVSCSYFTNYWFPWLVIAGGQVPCALAWALVVQKARRSSESLVRCPGCSRAGCRCRGIAGHSWLRTAPIPIRAGRVWKGLAGTEHRRSMARSEDDLPYKF